MMFDFNNDLCVHRHGHPNFWCFGAKVSRRLENEKKAEFRDGFRAGISAVVGGSASSYFRLFYGGWGSVGDEFLQFPAGTTSAGYARITHGCYARAGVETALFNRILQRRA